MRTCSALSILVGLGLTLTACTAAQGPAVTPTAVAQEGAWLEAQAKAQAEEQHARVQRVGRQLLTGIPNTPQIEFVVVPDAGRINVGTDTQKIAITSGLLQFVHSDDELAVVLAHQIAHVMQSHVVPGHVTRADMWQVPTAAETGGEAATGPDEKHEKANPEQFFSHQFTQRQELEADALGLRYMGMAGYNPQTGGALWERWAGVPAQPGIADFFASHPSSPERSASARKVLAKLLSPPSNSAPVAAVAVVDIPSQPAVAPEPATVPVTTPPPASEAAVNVPSQSERVPESVAAPVPITAPEPEMVPASASDPAPVAAVAATAVQSQSERVPEPVAAPVPITAPEPEMVPAPAAVQQSAVAPVTAPPPAPRQSLFEMLEGLDQLYYHGHITAREYWRQRDALVQGGAVPPPLPQLGAITQESTSRATEVVTPQAELQPGPSQPSTQDAMDTLLDEFKQGKITLEEYRKRRNAIEVARE